MNQNYSKINVLYEAVRSVLINDKTETAQEVREFKYYCNERVTRGFLPIAKIFPQCAMKLSDVGSNLGLPSAEYDLELRIWVDINSTYPQTTLENIATRAIFLLDHKPENLNNSILTEKNLRCRLINKMSAHDYTDELENKSLYCKVLFFRVICDDEILTSI
jgi:hypothetical protein